MSLQIDSLSRWLAAEFNAARCERRGSLKQRRWRRTCVDTSDASFACTQRSTHVRTYILVFFALRSSVSFCCEIVSQKTYTLAEKPHDAREPEVHGKYIRGEASLQCRLVRRASADEWRENETHCVIFYSAAR